MWVCGIDVIKKCLPAKYYYKIRSGMKYYHTTMTLYLYCTIIPGTIDTVVVHTLPYDHSLHSVMFSRQVSQPATAQPQTDVLHWKIVFVATAVRASLSSARVNYTSRSYMSIPRGITIFSIINLECQITERSSKYENIPTIPITFRLLDETTASSGGRNVPSRQRAPRQFWGKHVVLRCTAVLSPLHASHRWRVSWSCR